MPTFYKYTQNGTVYSFDDTFVPAEAFTQGALWAWGYNSYGQVGNNSSGGDVTTPVTVYGSGLTWKQVAGGNSFSAAIKTDGTLWTWGANSYGQLGNNTTTPQCTPVTVPSAANTWKQVSCGSGNVGSVKSDGTLWVWGRNDKGQLGNNTTTSVLTPIQTYINGTNWKQVSCAFFHTAAVKTDGTLWTWGYNAYGQLGLNDTVQRLTPTQVGSSTNWKQVSCGQYHTSAVKSDGTLWTWGINNYGQLGTNSSSSVSTPTTTFGGGSNWSQVYCGYNHTIGIKTDGTLWNWGSNAYGQMGTNQVNIPNGQSFNKLTPVTTTLGGTNWKQAAGGNGFTIAVKTDGTLWTWGSSIHGQIGTGLVDTNVPTPTTTLLGGTNWKQVDAGFATALAVSYINNYQ
jgi:alpha-tubulin suppressor-like RCC1 family protein